MSLGATTNTLLLTLDQDFYATIGLINALWQERSSIDLQAIRITCQTFDSMTKGREENQREIIYLILKQISRRKRLMHEHALGWLIGHSIGMPYFDELLDRQKKFFNY